MFEFKKKIITHYGGTALLTPLPRSPDFHSGNRREQVGTGTLPGPVRIPGTVSFNPVLSRFPYTHVLSSPQLETRRSPFADLWSSLSVHLPPLWDSVLWTPDSQLYLLNSGSPSGSTCLPPPYAVAWKFLKAITWGLVVGLTSFVSCLSEVITFSAWCPVSWKSLFHILCLSFGSVIWEDKSGPNYFILIRSWNLGTLIFCLFICKAHRSGPMTANIGSDRGW